MLSLWMLPASLQAFLATLAAWLLTSIGAISVLFFRPGHRLLLNAMLAAGGGVMLASSFWSLLSPAFSMAETLDQPGWLVCCGGFLLGALCLMLLEALLSRLGHSMKGLPDTERRRRMLFTSITLHNIPEGMAIGVAFGAALTRQDLTAAWMLALGIGLQNIPEGAAVSLPLHRDGMDRTHAALEGILSGAVEPLAGLLGALLAATVNSILPCSLSIAAGAMIYVVVSELIPESQSCSHPQVMTFATLLGFTVMMLLDVMLG